MSHSRFWTKAAFALLAVLFLAGKPAVAGPISMFLELDGVKGESTSTIGKDQIEVLSFKHAVSMPLTTGASGVRTRGRTVHDDFTITKFSDLTTPTLNLNVSGGTDIRTARLHLFKAQPEDGAPFEYFTYEFESVILTSLSIAGTGDLPIETLTFRYNKIKWNFKSLKVSQPGGARGTISTGWDLERNTKV